MAGPARVSDLTANEQRSEDSGPALSGPERQRLKRGRETWLPLGFVVLTLAFAVVVPRLAERRITRLRDEINDGAIPAHQRASEIELHLALAAAQLRGYLLSRDSASGNQVAVSQARRRDAERQLMSLVRGLDESADLPSTVARLTALTAQLDSMIVADTGRAVTGELIRNQRHRFLAIQGLADSISVRIDSAAEARRTEIGETEDTVALLTGLSLLLGCAAAVVVARLGQRFRVLALRLDESERQARDIAIREQLARAELERVTESRHRLLRGFTHDIKNPLGAADGFLVLVQDRVYGEMPEKARETVARVRRSIGQALELIGRLLDIARAEAGQLEIRRTQVDVRELVREVVDAFSAQARAKNIALTDDPDPEPIRAHTDGARVRQVVGNLVSNAVKYTPPGGHILVSANVTSDVASNGRRSVTVSVADDGPGMAPDKVPMLFKEFTRFDPGAAEGAGVGLAISQKIAEALGGRIIVETRENEGSKFTLQLPVGDRSDE